MSNTTGKSAPPAGQVKIEEKEQGEGKDLAQQEAAAISAGRDISKEERENEHDRREELRGLVHRVICYIVAGAFLSFAIGALAVFTHMIFPSVGWLSAAQLTDLKVIGGSALVSAVLTQVGKQLLSKL